MKKFNGVSINQRSGSGKAGPQINGKSENCPDAATQVCRMPVQLKGGLGIRN